MTLMFHRIRMRTLMRTLVIAIAISFASTSRSDEEPVYFYNSKIDGQEFTAGAVLKWIRETPDWKPGEPLPITVEAAIASAKKELERHAPKDEYWQFDYIDILSFRNEIKGKWYFLVEFGALSERSGAFVKARIPVNMKGVAAELFRIPETKKPINPRP
jgi:hypothetical protein